MPARRIVEAAQALADADPVLAGLIGRYGLPSLPSRSTEHQRFEALARAIVYQQLAGKAAASIHARVSEALGGAVTPEGILARPTEELRRCGLSGAKEAALRDLAGKTVTGQIALARIGRWGDQEIVDHLVQVRGVGEWTAHMFLITTLGRLDVWPTGDFGVRGGFAVAFDLDAVPSPQELGALGERFRPYRTLVAWYCWRAADEAKGRTGV